MRRRTRFNESAPAAAKQAQQMLLSRRGISPTMWERLDMLHIARLGKERGIRADLREPTMVALWNRGLVQGKDVQGYDGWLWSLTDAGRAAVKGPRDAE